MRSSRSTGTWVTNGTPFVGQSCSDSMRIPLDRIMRLELRHTHPVQSTFDFFESLCAIITIARSNSHNGTFTE